MIPSKRLLPTFLLLFLVTFLTISCSQQSSHSPQPVSQNQKPDRINKVPAGHYLGQASYALQTVKQAREKALNTAVSLLVAAKAGNTAEVSGDVQNKTTSVIRGGRESLTNSSTINTTVTISGKEIPVQEVYRGLSHEVTLLNKVRLEIALNDDYVNDAIEAITKVAQKDGDKGRGKIFILPFFF